jgi:sialic acid synthase SpsE
MTMEIFSSWFEIFKRQVREWPLLLIVDGHRSHLGFDFIQNAREANVSVVKLPSHTTDLLQPLDVSRFKVLKTSWDNALVSYQRRMKFCHVSKAETANILCSIWKSSLSQATIQAGFRKAGIYPLDRSMYPTTKFSLDLLQ